MTTGTKVELSAVMHRWALAQLDLQPGTPGDEARRKLLKQLSEMDFMPPIAWDSALRVSNFTAGGSDQTAPAFVPARRAAEESLRAEVDDFAAKFFSLAPDVRIVRHRDLLKRCADAPALVVRLESLAPALELPSEAPAGQSGEVVQLLEQTMRLFVLPRQERADQRWRFVKHCQADRAAWRVAAAVVQREHVRHAALEPALIGELSMPPNREKQRARLAHRRKVQLRRSRIVKRLFGNEYAYLVWVLVPAVTLGLFLGFFKEAKKSPRGGGNVSQPSSQSNLQKANEEMNKFVNDSLRQGKPIPEALRRLYGLPPQKAPSPPPIPAPPTATTQRVEVRIAKSREQAQEMLRQLQGPQSNGGPPQTVSSAPPQDGPVQVLSLEQAREKLRQLQEQRAESGPDPLRDAMIAGLENAIQEASRNSEKQQ